MLVAGSPAAGIPYYTHVFHPNVPEFQPLPATSVPAADITLRQFSNNWKNVRAALLKASSRYKKFADKKRRAIPALRAGDFVWLSTKNLILKVPSMKFAPRYIGPFLIEQVINPVAYKLKLPPFLKIPRTFHISLLKPVILSCFHSALPSAPKVQTQRGVEYEVAKILDSHFRSYVHVRATCSPGELAAKAASLISKSYVHVRATCSPGELAAKAASLISKSYVHVRATCSPGELAAKAASLISNYSRNHPVFLQPSDYFWVKNESMYGLPFGTRGSEELLMKILSLTSQYHVPQEIERLQCRRCVVVGNGHRLKNSSLGEIINKYDVVIRLNKAPVHKYEKDVGSKTTMRFFYPESAHFDVQLDNNPDTLLVLVPFKPLDIQWIQIMFNDEKRVRKGFFKMPPIIWDADPQNTRILNPYYMEVTAMNILRPLLSKKKNVKPTTGMLAITFALHFCDQVHIAGFGYPALSNKTQLVHYYEEVTMKSMAASPHNLTLEAMAIRKFLQHRLLQNLTYF
ncbi:CMP-N-acetylneuraminate-beta-galactosamide-alpha-2,3-sialyltransferase 4-like [Pseudophryne corroboree]|uniref:CMP-N-acetylneuraminate-beta-galactosamide- alpha-2,3-sialyltransferase 4-like n=1 Tax=Pseudophryne corroboree TaxID=495146 RepID=UPI003081228A